MKFLIGLFLAVVVSAAEPAKPCVFCEIIAGTRPAVVIWRDDTVIAIMDHSPVNPGHVLIMPIKHADNYLEVPPATLEKMIVLAQRIGQALRRTDLNTEGIEVLMNTGKAAGQAVPHAHLHVIPRITGDDADSHPKRPITPADQLEAVAARIRAALPPM